MKKKLPTISAQLKKWLLIPVLCVFLLTSAFSLFVQYRAAFGEAERLLSISIMDVIDEVKRKTDEYQIVYSEMVASAVRDSDINDLGRLADIYMLEEIDILDENGIITDSTDKSLIGYDMKSLPETAEYIEELKEQKSASLREILPAEDETRISKYSACVLREGSFLQIGYSRKIAEYCYEDMVDDYTVNRHILESGMLFIINADNEVVSIRSDHDEEIIRSVLEENDLPCNIRTVYAGGRSYYSMYDTIGSFRVVAVLPCAEVMEGPRLTALISVIVGVIVFVTLYAAITLLVKRTVVRQVGEIADTLKAITEGDLDAQVSVYTSREFDIISNGINSTLDSLKDHIAREAARIDDELRYAREIQYSALPALTGQFTDDPRFSLFASMDSAKEVGGDFYDFYMINDHTLVFTIADVSGKGIPAAMFMMNGKAKLHDCTDSPDDPGSCICRANKRICEGNDAGMFITAWVGVLDLISGELRFVNAGHTNPVLIRDGKAEMPGMKVNLILGILDVADYTTQTMQLKKGDVLFLYTDGVNEALNADLELYGNERLIEALNGITPGGDDICAEICRTVRASVEKFAAGAPQADDITMLCLYFKGQN